MTDENDKRRVLHLYHFEMLYAAVVETFIEWQTAIVEAVIRASLSGATPPCLRAHERCTSKMASLLQLATSYREGREWRCECHLPQLHVRPSELFDPPLDEGRRGLHDRRRSLARNQCLDGPERARLRPHLCPVRDGGPRRQGAEEAEQVHHCGPCARRRRAAGQFGADRRRAHGLPVCEPRVVARAEPRAGAGPSKAHYPRTHLLELARELRRASAGRGLGGIGLVGGAWE